MTDIRQYVLPAVGAILVGALIGLVLVGALAWRAGAFS